MMETRILLGIDADLSPITQFTLHEISTLIGRSPSSIYLVLLNVIPVTQVIAMHPGMYVGQVVPLATPSWQRSQAEEVLRKARVILQQEGIALEHTEALVRVGAPADEIVKVARELQVRLIVVGSRGSSFKQRLRRWFLGSISRRVLRCAPCPVLVVIPPQAPRTPDLTAWYEEMIRRYLREHPQALSVFTPQEAALKFAPDPQKTPGRKEVRAASFALDKLAQEGILCRHAVQGELRYVND